MSVRLLRSISLFLLPALLLFPFSSSGYFNDTDHRVFANGSREARLIALTFDDGPHPVYTDEIREILLEYDIKATFFVIGVNAEYYPAPLERLIADGHVIGSHTYRHRRIKEETREELAAELLKNEEVLAHFGISPRLFRPPEGVCTSTVIGAAHHRNYDIILWTVDTEDWKAPPAEKIVETVLGSVQGGDIILMHDYVEKSHTPEALRILIPALLDKGYRFVTVEELIQGTAS